MSALRVHSNLKPGQAKALGLAGDWNVWAQAADAPGAYFIVPANDDARALGIKFAVIKAVTTRTSIEPELSLLRTDPHKPNLTQKGPRR